MKRIYLSKDEKRLLHNIALDVDYWPEGMGEETLSACADELKDKGLIDAAFGSGHTLEGADLTTKGISYLQKNPKLTNPLNWDIVTAVSTAITAIIAVAAFVLGLISCTKLLH